MDRREFVVDSRWIGMGASCLMILIWLGVYGFPEDGTMAALVAAVAMIQTVAGYMLGTYVNKLRRMAYHDSLTGVLVNRRFIDKLEQEVQLAKRNQYPVTLLFIDLDNFKDFNDRHGHIRGDQLLCQFADLLQVNVRRQDIVGRWGGEEFVVLLPQTETRVGLGVGERIQKQVRSLLSGVTVSIGVASYPLHAVSAKELTEKADTLMYEAKKKKDCMLAATN
ncbi:GGDEF domain-containing protein [Brevibacillus sp. SIMBA_040]|uniref:GGDEF domain-containing protein n=1 Tax=unclassified Brevibacillus TaxID=2684853 RepID=UPI003978A151